MSLHSTINTLSNINALLGSTTGFVNARNNGMPLDYALMGYSNSIMSGMFRNSMADSIYHNSGSYMGYNINNCIGYGDPYGDYQASQSLMGAAMFTSPWMFNPCMTSTIYGCGPYGHWDGGFLGGGMFSCGPFGGYRSMFAPMGFLC